MVRLRVLSILAFFVGCSLFSATLSEKQLFQRLTGKPLLLTDPRYAQIEKLMNEGKLEEAAHLVTEDPDFYSTVVRDWAAPMSNRPESSLVPLNDFIATVIGAARDDLDARTLLSGDYRYEGRKELGLTAAALSNNLHYAELEKKNSDLKADLVQVSPQWPGLSDAAGLLTTRGWAEAHYIAGTNRRAIEFSFQEFLCAPIQSWRTSGLPVSNIRRDVTRAPAGSPETFEKECRTCHSAMDGFSGAFARKDFQSDRFLFSNQWIAPKMNQNAHVYPKGYTVASDAWMNLLQTPANQAMFGWRGPMDGAGTHAFGEMLSNSKRFSQCMTRRVFQKVCLRELEPSENEWLQKTSEQFEKEHYRLRKLFEMVAISETCAK